jgi:hypothetical protein
MLEGLKLIIAIYGLNVDWLNELTPWLTGRLAAGFEEREA